MPPALPVVRVTGTRRNVGKTWLATRLVAELTARGYRVAAIKRSHHPVTPDRPGSDSDCFAGAGAAAVLFCGADGTLERSPAATLEQALDRYAGDADVAIVEGFKEDTLGAVIRLAGDDARHVAFAAMDGTLLLETVAGDVAGLADAIERQFMLSAAGDDALRADIRRAARAHGHLCAGVVLGVRMGRLGMRELGLSAPAPPHALRVTVEVARCATDALAAVTGCSAGQRNLRVEDYGKMAATFEDVRTGRAVRVLAREDVRDPDATWAPPALARGHRQAIAYRLMPDAQLFTRQDVRVLHAHATPGMAERPRERMACRVCGEAIRVAAGAAPLGAVCPPCAVGRAYYEAAAAAARDVVASVTGSPR